ncbi:hypothetical protein Zmor_026172 [Zophobas morio]|uniref:Uncharacterized protein n=2 Tax=Zophobas morio TaxID=2755281 RepID=A0AA38M5R5_9CUCU|nr:hypothetical protein Zmor_026172 [Zophobas morio]
MQCLVKVIYIYAILESLKCEDHVRYFEDYQSNNFFFRVYKKTSFTLDYGSVPILGEASISDIPNMEELMLYDIKLQKIQPGAFQDLPMLKSLKIIKTNISKIDVGVFNNLNITSLTILENKMPLTIAADAFDNMTSLQKIRLDQIQLTLWNPQWFANTPQLKEIYACDNLLQKIPRDAFKNLNGDNEITIYFYRNRIKKIHNDAFHGIRKMKILSLADNKLEEFNGHSLKNVKIEELRISENNLQCLEESDFAGIFVADKTAIGGNPWRQECLDKILEWGVSHNKTIKTINYFPTPLL